MTNNLSLTLICPGQELIGQRMETRTVQKFQTVFIVALTMWLLCLCRQSYSMGFPRCRFCPIFWRGRKGLHIMIHFINLFWWSWQESKEFLPIYNSHGLCQVFENNAACIESAKEPSYHLGLSTPWQFNCFTFIVSSPQAHSWYQTYQQHKWMNCRYIHQATLCSALRYLRENLIGVWIKEISRECAKFRHSVYQPSPIT